MGDGDIDNLTVHRLRNMKAKMTCKSEESNAKKFQKTEKVRDSHKKGYWGRGYVEWSHVDVIPYDSEETQRLI